MGVSASNCVRGRLKARAWEVESAGWRQQDFDVTKSESGEKKQDRVKNINVKALLFVLDNKNKGIKREHLLLYDMVVIFKMKLEKGLT